MSNVCVMLLSYCHFNSNTTGVAGGAGSKTVNPFGF